MTDIDSDISRLFVQDAEPGAGEIFVGRVAGAVRTRRLARRLGLAAAILAAAIGAILAAGGTVACWPVISLALGPAIALAGPSILVGAVVAGLALCGPRLIRIIRA